jgi:hypothetical protein
MLFAALGLLLGAAVLLWCFVLALTFAEGDSKDANGFRMRLLPTSVSD